MLLKQAICTHKSHARKKSLQHQLHIENLASPRSGQLFSQRSTHVTAATKRIIDVDTPRRSHHGKGSRLTFSKNLFKQARKVDKRNPRESFLPLDSNIKTDNQTKTKIVLSAYSKLHGRPREGSPAQKVNKLGKLCKIEEIDESAQFKPSLFCQPPPSSLTRLILNECNQWAHQRADALDSSLHDILEEERYSQWINILCAQSIAPEEPSQKKQSIEGNPYQLGKKGRKCEGNEFSQVCVRA